MVAITFSSLLQRISLQSAFIALYCIPVLRCWNSSCQSNVSEVQPTLYSQLCSSYSSNIYDAERGSSAFPPLLRRITDVARCDYESDLIVSEAAGVPSSQGWSRCRWCGWKNNQVYLRTKYTPKSASSSSAAAAPIKISWSVWGEFFHNFQNDQYTAVVESSNDFFSPVYIVDRPVYVIPMITFHIGHILVDVVEQLYHSMILHYGRVRKDALLIIDVAAALERPVLQHKLSINIEENSEASESVANLLKAYTTLPVFSIELLHQLSDIGGVVFQDIHFGLDNTHAHFQYGFASHPCIMNLHANSKLQQLASRYREFREFVFKFYAHRQNSTQQNIAAGSEVFSSNTIGYYHHYKIKGNAAADTIHVLVVQRTSNRIILNLNDILSHITRVVSDFDIELVDLASTPFTRQLELFQRADILVSVAGTSLHNSLFMRPSLSAVVIIMQPRWCSWSWMYANQAVLMNIRPYVYCSEAAGHMYPEELDARDGFPVSEVEGNPRRFLFFQWSRKFWLQGPRFMKSENITLERSKFVELLQEAKMHVVGLRDKHLAATSSLSQSPGIRDGTHHDSDSIATDPPACFGYSPHLYRTLIERQYSISDGGVEPPVHDDRSRLRVCDSHQLRYSRTAEMYVSQVLVTKHAGNSKINGWRIALMGEIALPQHGLQPTAESFPRISVCFRTLPAVDHYSPPADQSYLLQHLEQGSMFDFFLAREEINDFEATQNIPVEGSWHSRHPPVCYPFASLNYYSDLYLDVGDVPVHSLHLWAQTSPVGGKIKGSDVFASLDCRLPNCGFSVASNAESAMKAAAQRFVEISDSVDFGVVVHHKCIQNVTFIDDTGAVTSQLNTAPQVLSFTTQQAESAPSIYSNYPVLCESNVTITFHWRISSALSLQRYVTDFCSCHALTTSNCGTFMSTALRFLVSWIHLLEAQLANSHVSNHLGVFPVVPLPLIQSSPSPRNPFFFVHVEKTAGSSLREFIWDSAERLKVHAYIPCHSDLPCVTFALPKHSSTTIVDSAPRTVFYTDRPTSTPPDDISIVAGHFSWGTWRDLPQCSMNSIEGTDSSNHVDRGFANLTCRPSCFTMARHPVQRSISYYYQRLFLAVDSIGYQRQIQELSSAELEEIIVHERSILPSDYVPDTLVYIDEGLSNGACRTLLSLPDKLSGRIVQSNIRLNTRAPEGFWGAGRRYVPANDSFYDLGNQTEYFDADLVANAVFNMKHCVVGLQERWIDSLKMLNHWFPWIDTTKNPYRRKLQLVQGQETHELLRIERPDLYEILLKYNNCDMVLYEESVKRFTEQAEFLRSHYF